MYMLGVSTQTYFVEHSVDDTTNCCTYAIVRRDRTKTEWLEGWLNYFKDIDELTVSFGTPS